MRLFPDIVLTKTEEDIIEKALSNPAVKKYFNMLAYNVAQGIAVARKDSNQTLEDFYATINTEQGKLIVLEMLLEIEMPASQPKPT